MKLILLLVFVCISASAAKPVLTKRRAFENLGRDIKKAWSIIMDCKKRLGWKRSITEEVTIRSSGGTSKFSTLKECAKLLYKVVKDGNYVDAVTKLIKSSSSSSSSPSLPSSPSRGSSHNNYRNKHHAGHGYHYYY